MMHARKLPRINEASFSKDFSFNKHRNAENTSRNYDYSQRNDKNSFTYRNGSSGGKSSRGSDFKYDSPSHSSSYDNHYADTSKSSNSRQISPDVKRSRYSSPTHASRRSNSRGNSTNYTSSSTVSSRNSSSTSSKNHHYDSPYRLTSRYESYHSSGSGVTNKSRFDEFSSSSLRDYRSSNDGKRSDTSIKSYSGSDQNKRGDYAYRSRNESSSSSTPSSSSFRRNNVSSCRSRGIDVRDSASSGTQQSCGDNTSSSYRSRSRTSERVRCNGGGEDDRAVNNTNNRGLRDSEINTDQGSEEADSSAADSVSPSPIRSDSDDDDENQVHNSDYRQTSTKRRMINQQDQRHGNVGRSNNLQSSANSMYYRHSSLSDIEEDDNIEDDHILNAKDEGGGSSMRCINDHLLTRHSRDESNCSSSQYSRYTEGGRGVSGSGGGGGESSSNNSDEGPPGCNKLRPQPPSNWSQQKSSSGKVYFYNCVSEVSQWEKPQELVDYERILNEYEMNLMRSQQQQQRSSYHTVRHQDHEEEQKGGGGEGRERGEVATSTTSLNRRERGSHVMEDMNRRDMSTNGSSQVKHHSRGNIDFLHQRSGSDQLNSSSQTFKSHSSESQMSSKKEQNPSHTDRTYLASKIGSHENERNGQNRERIGSSSIDYRRSKNATDSNGESTRKGMESSLSPSSHKRIVRPQHQDSVDVGSHTNIISDSTTRKKQQKQHFFPNGLLQNDHLRVEVIPNHSSVHPHSSSSLLLSSPPTQSSNKSLIHHQPTLSAQSSINGHLHSANSSSSSSSSTMPPSSSSYSSALDSLSPFYNQALISHVLCWPAEAMEKNAIRINDDHTSMDNLSLTRISSQLKMARSLVRLAEIQATLQEQRIFFLRQQCLDMQTMKTTTITSTTPHVNSHPIISNSNVNNPQSPSLSSSDDLQ